MVMRNGKARRAQRYQVWIDGLEAGSVGCVEDAWALVLQAGSTAPIGSVLRYQVRQGAEVVGEGELDVSPLAARDSAPGCER